MATVTPPLNILILGAGIAGLTCALALRKEGHTVTLLEKSKFSAYTETGAAVHVAPNAAGHLLRLGWDPVRSGSNLCEGMQAMTAEGKIQYKNDLREFNKQWSNPFYLSHRVDLHRELRRLAVDEAGAELVLGVKIVDIDVERGVVREEGGRSWEGDVVIGADGNKSFARGCVEERELRPWDLSCYRWLVDRQTLLSDPEASEIVAQENYFAEVSAQDRRIIMYPCRNNAMLNLAAFVPAHEVDEGDADWLSQGSKSYLATAFSSFYAPARKIVSYAGEDLKVWQLMDMESLSRWNKRRLALIGDAAHPFLPFLGQGAAQAMEDAVSIATILARGTKSEDVQALLQLYDGVRRERVNYIQEATRKNGLEEGKGRPPPGFMIDMLKFCYPHDEWENSKTKLEEWKQQRSS